MSNYDGINIDGLKGSEQVKVACGRCMGTGMYQAPTGFTDNHGRPYCFECDGLGYGFVLVSSIKAAIRREAKQAAERAAIEAEQAEQAERFEAAHPGLLAWIAQFRDMGGFLDSCADKGAAMSPRMVEVATRIKMEREGAQAAAEANPLPEGRRVLTGTVLSVKETHSDFGTTWKMTVDLGDGHRVYGSVPRSLDDAVSMEHRLGGHFDEGFYVPLIGGKVTFTATVERSQKDPAFGFFSRPTKATLDARSARR